MITRRAIQIVAIKKIRVGDSAKDGISVASLREIKLLQVNTYMTVSQVTMGLNVPAVVSCQLCQLCQLS